LAVIAIIALQPKIHAIFKVKNKWLEKVWSLTSVSIAAQLGTMPISFYYFHQFPNYFFISNIFAIPLATIILYVAVFLLAINWIPILSNIVAFVLKLSVKSLLVSLKFVSFLPLSTTKNIYFNVPELILMYSAIILFFIFIYKKKKILLYSTFVAILIFFSLEVFYRYQKINENLLVIYNAKNNLIFNKINHTENIVIAENPFDSVAFKNICHQLWLVERKNQPQIKNLNFAENLKLSDEILFKNNFLKIGNITFYIIDDNLINDFENKQKIKVDYIVLTNSTKIKVDVIKKLFDFKEFIIASDNKLSYVNKIKKILTKNKIKYFDINTQGALVLDYYTKQKKRL
jgi:competence protein ComEC